MKRWQQKISPRTATPPVLSHPIMESAFKDSEATTQCQNQACGGKKNQETEEQKKKEACKRTKQDGRPVKQAGHAST